MQSIASPKAADVALQAQQDGNIQLDSPPVSLLVINHNGKSKLQGLLDDCLESLVKTSYPNFEILFVDNCSDDGTADYVKERFGNYGIRIVKMSSNLGYAGAVNAALKLAQGNIIGVLNNDITAVDPFWLATLVRYMQREPSVGIVSPALLHDEKRIDSMGGDANVLMVAWDSHSREEFFTPSDTPIFPISPPGAAFLFRRDLAKKMDNEIFDPDYFAYYEDVMLGFQVTLMGQRVAVLPSTTLQHKRGGSWGVISPTKFFFQRRNAVWTGITVFNTSEVLFMLPLWLISNLYAGFVYFRMTRNPRFLLSPFRVIFAVLSGMRRTWSKHMRFHQKNGSSAKALNFSPTMILGNEKLTFGR
ncbi:MAG TPA: glycosyltransferase family 2 protein, partial [Candidatus Bathyarchaeia archaeon]|nr:glycosyltransferase family 2 protein [Candidatus Bathyarchaeia archaeon]